MCSLKTYKEGYDERSKLHVENILQYGPQVVLGYPEMLRCQKERLEYIMDNVNRMILDVGCDSGYISSRCDAYASLDISLSRLTACKRWFTTLKLIHGVAECLPFKDGCFDTVILSELLEHVLNPLLVLTEARRVLRVGGKVVVTVPDEIDESPHRNVEHLRSYSLEMLKQHVLKIFILDNLFYIGGDFPTWCLTAVKRGDVDG